LKVRLPFVEIKRLRRALGGETSPLRRAIVRAAGCALRDGVPSVNLTAPREVYDELFSFLGAGTLFTEHQYGDVRPIAIDDFEEAATLIKRGQDEGSLLPRDDDEIARLLPSCFGYRVGDENLAGIVSLLTEPYRRERAGEITGLYTLTRFQREGVAHELLREVIAEARARRLRYVFACTAEDNAARFFARLKFRRVSQSAGETPAAKWRGYDRTRIPRLVIFRQDLR
jgi:N-acetylglutamate synthase-like GNAT family acetyltransferase